MLWLSMLQVERERICRFWIVRSILEMERQSEDVIVIPVPSV